jgi:hypothetical protein
MSEVKRYKLKQSIFSPQGNVKAGEVRTIEQWHNQFPDLLGHDLLEYDEWWELEEIKPTESKEWEIVKEDYVGEASHKSIISVRRKSDNEVFTVGDETNCGTIKEFRVMACSMMFQIKERESWTEISFAKKLPPLSNKQENKDVFTWDEESAKEYGKFCVLNHSWLQWEDFKQSKQPLKPDTKERIVVNIGTLDSGGQIGIPHQYPLVTSNPIAKEQIPLIKQAVESVLNDDVKRGKDFYVEIPPGETILTMFTKEQMDKAISDAFYAGKKYYRVQIPSDGYQYGDIKFYYLTLNDYLNSLNNK